jgi:hypothetical protein
MAYTAGDVVLAEKGYIYFAVGTSSSVPAIKPTIPADPSSNPTVPTGWVGVGSVSADTPVTIGRTQDDPTALPTWAAPSGIRVTSPAVKWNLQFAVLDQSQLALDLYFGAGGVSGAGSYAVSRTSSGTANYGALYVHFLDGAHAGGKLGLYIPKVSIIGSDDLAYATDALNVKPVTATLLDAGGSNNLLEWVDTAIV